MLLRCPKCKHQMQYEPRVRTVSGIRDKSKRCVYCGRSFKVTKNIVKS